MLIYTIGHSTRPIDEFVQILQQYGVHCVVDDRTIAKSRHNPQFGADQLAPSLAAAGLDYLRLESLGGLRHTRKDSINGAWKNASFRGYADYMQTPEFAAGINQLIELGVVKAGHAIYMDDVVNGAMSFSTTLSIPYALKALVPQITAALGADAATGTTAGTGNAAASAIVPGADPELDAVVAAYTIVFDSATRYAEKAPFLPEAGSVKATVEGYAKAGEAVGGIKLVPKAVTIDGDNATVIYDVLFAGTAVYNGLSGSAVKVDGAWTITKAEFCGFMSSARNPCP